MKPDPKSLNYCGYKCTAECSLYKATPENNIELKKKAYEEFKFKEKFGVDFNPDKVFCYGCKLKDKPLSINVKSCSVHKCAMDIGYKFLTIRRYFKLCINSFIFQLLTRFHLV